jgi:hypothetical protein
MPGPLRTRKAGACTGISDELEGAVLPPTFVGEYRSNPEKLIFLSYLQIKFVYRI